MKSWLIIISVPYTRTEQYYAAYAEDNHKIYDFLYDSSWFDEKCQMLWDSYGSRLGDSWEEEWEKMSNKEELYENDYDKFMEENYNLWCENCGLDIKECPEEDFSMYVPGGQGKLEIVYDERF